MAYTTSDLLTEVGGCTFLPEHKGCLTPQKNVGSISMDKVGADSWITNQQSVPWEGSKACVSGRKTETEQNRERWFLFSP